MLPPKHPLNSLSPSRQIALGTVTSVDEAVQWLSYTYLYVRMRMNPLVYGIPNSFREVGHVTITWYSHDLLHVDCYRPTCKRTLYRSPQILFIFTFKFQTDPTLELYMRGLIESSARFLFQVRMIRFVEHTGSLHSTDLGRTASHYYINTASIEVEITLVACCPDC